MERSHDEKITREVGREICQRRGIKVLMVSTIARLGRNYVITLEAVNSQSGDSVAQQQTEAEGKEQVLQSLGRAATEIRKKLGESLASIQKFNVPIEQATTASLAAFKDFMLGIELRRKAKYAESVPPFKRPPNWILNLLWPTCSSALLIVIYAIWRWATGTSSAHTTSANA
jgi:hypothetical protein